MNIKFSFEIFSSARAYSDEDEKVEYIDGLKDLAKKIQATLLEDEEVHEEFEMRDVAMELKSKTYGYASPELDEKVCKRVGGKHWDVDASGVATCVVILNGR